MRPMSAAKVEQQSSEARLASQLAAALDPLADDEALFRARFEELQMGMLLLDDSRWAASTSDTTKQPATATPSLSDRHQGHGSSRSGGASVSSSDGSGRGGGPASRVSSLLGGAGHDQETDVDVGK
jgi:hypothetical protein